MWARRAKRESATEESLFIPISLLLSSRVKFTVKVEENELSVTWQEGVICGRKGEANQQVDSIPVQSSAYLLHGVCNLPFFQGFKETEGFHPRCLDCPALEPPS